MKPFSFKKCIVSTLIVAIVILSTYIILNRNNEKFEEKRIFHYELEIDPVESGNYTVYLPVPIASRANSPLRDKPTALMNELLIINGSGNYEIILTDYGYALNVTSNTSILISAHREFLIPSNDAERDYIFEDLSLIGSNSWKEHRFYLNSTTTNVILDFSCYYREEYEKNGFNSQWGVTNQNVINGWHELDILIEKSPDVY